MAWLTQWWMLLATLLVVFIPGLVAAWSIGLRRLGAWAFAPLGSVAIISVVATAYGVVSIPWTLLSSILGVAVVAVGLVTCRFLFRIRPAPQRAAGARWPVLVGLVTGATLLTVRVTAYIGDPGNISQTNDAAFHLGAVRAIIEHANASSFGLAGLIDPAASGAFYPGAWHATDSIISMLTGDIAVSTNMLALVFAAVVWPLGVTWLTQVVTGRRLAAAAAAVMSSMLVIFPLEMIQYGVLYAYFLGVALLPAGIAVVVALTVRGGVRAAPTVGRVAAPILGFVMAVAAIGLAQPSVVLALGLALWLYTAGTVVMRWSRLGAKRWGAMAGLVVALAILAGAWWAMGRLVTAGVWRAVRSGGDALIEILTAGFVKTPPAWWVSVLLAVGLVAVVRHARSRWLAFGWFAFAFLAFVAYAVRNELARVLLVGPWYSDPYRLAALVPVMMIPVAAVGVVVLVDKGTKLWMRRRRTGPSPGTRRGVVRARLGAVAVGLLMVIGIITVAVQPVVLRFKLLDGFAESESPYWVTENAWLSVDERTLLSRVGDQVPEGARVLGNPHTGAALGYFLTGVDIYPAKWQVPRHSAYSVLKTRLHDASTDPEVCEAVHALGAEYVLDFGIGTRNAPGTVEQMPGFTAFDGVAGFELVDREGEAELWRITACG